MKCPAPDAVGLLARARSDHWGGLVHQALLKDEISRLARDCCLPADVWALCGLDDYDDCMEVCWQEMEKRGWK